MSGNENHPWHQFMASEGSDEYAWEDENEDRLWYCPHGKAYAIRCRPCEESDD